MQLAASGKGASETDTQGAGPAHAVGEVAHGIMGVAAVALADPAWGGLTWFYPVAFFVLSIAHSGVRIGRKTYLVDMAGGTKRTDYTAVSNTVIGVLLLVLGGVSAAVSLLGAQWALLLLGAMGVLGTFWSWKLKEVE